jgi:hypothetical protein
LDLGRGHRGCAPFLSEDDMTTRHKLPDCPIFREMWAGSKPRNAIAIRFGVTVVEVSQMARAYGYPERHSPRMVLQGPMPARRPARDPGHLSQGASQGAPVVPKRVAALAGDRWSAAQIAEVFRTGGRYAELSVLAARWSVPVTVLVGLWHRVRVAA